jgi:hypothetical protein
MAIIGTYYGIHIRKPLKSLMNHWFQKSFLSIKHFYTF